MTDILIQENNDALVPPEFPTNVREQAPVLIQENILQDGGIAATVDVASTTTLDPDTPAYVNNIGDEKHAILQFGIPKGETGEAGVDGVDGQAATITVGSTTTLDPEDAATVVNSGTSQNAILDFGIPQGVQGEQGEQGISPRAYVEQTANGAMIHIDDYMTETNVEVLNGTDGTDGSDGFSPIATVSQTASGATISITDAQGTTTANITNGVDGQDGAAGQAATISVGSTTTGSAGTNASVVNSGTSSAAVFDFTIPRGADGAAGRDGTDGTDGTDGFSPIATVSQSGGTTTISITDKNGTTSESIVIPTVNDATLTIQKNGTTVQTFTANASSNATANISVPTQFSDLSGTVSNAQIADGSITESKLNDFSTANTTDTWVVVANQGKLQHRVIKTFNADGSIPTSAIANGAVTEDKIDYSSMTVNQGTATLNSTYLSGGCYWRRIGRLVIVQFSNISITSSPPNSSGTSAITNLPKLSSTYSNNQLYLLHSYRSTRKLRLGMSPNSTSMYFHWTSGDTAQEMDGEFVYFTD